MMNGAEAVLVSSGEAVPSDGATCSPAELMGRAALAAIEAAGLRPTDIDGLAASSIDYYMPTLSLGRQLGIKPLFMDSTSLGGSSPLAQLEHAVDSIAAGRCSTVVVAFGSTSRSDPRGIHRLTELSVYEAPHGYIYPLSGFSLMAARHMHVYGTTPEQLAMIAVNARRWAALAPGAERPELITVEDVLSSPIIASPLHRLDFCLVSDGAAAVVVTRRDRARDLKTKPVRILGLASAQSHRHISEMADLTTSPSRESGRRALLQSGVSLGHIDVLEIYDAATITVVMTLEDLGFCEKGEGGRFIASTNLGPGGSLPLNTNGTGLAYRHPGMLGLYLLSEAMTQLQGTAGARQVPGAKIALVNSLCGVYGASGTAVLASD
jgi:acetyl-CoA acetyltransferase